MDRMGSKCEISNTLHVAEWETPPVRSKLDMSGGSLLPLSGPLSGSCASPRVHAPIDIAELPLESCEPPSPSPKHSGHQVGGKILKFLKLRKKSNSVEATISQEAFQPSLTTFRFQDQSGSGSGKRFASVEDVDLERYHYDSDEHSESVSTSSANCDRHHRSSCSASDSSSSRSSQSFSSMTSRSSVTPRASFILAGQGHQSGAQLMANILISISNLNEDDERGYEYGHPTALDGPHESAWHQPRDEMFAAPLGAGRHSSAKPNSERNTPRLGRCSIDLHLTSPGPSRRFGKLDLSRIDKLR